MDERRAAGRRKHAWLENAERWEMQEPAGKIEEPLRAEGWEYKKEPLNAVRFTLKRAAGRRKHAWLENAER